MDQYQIGERPTFTATFTDLAGVLTSPTDGKWKLEDPSENIVEFAWGNAAVTQVSAGIVTFTPPSPGFDEPGLWSVRAEGTETISAVWELTFEVLPSAFSVEVGRYCKSSDLMVGDLTVSPARLSVFVDGAADEIDAELGFVYVTPIPLAGLPTHIALTLKRINVLIATGRYLLAQAVAGEDTANHAYGASLLKEGQGLLKSIVAGHMDLIGVTKVETYAEGNAPRVIQADAVSPLDAFYGTGGTPTGFVWGPGGL